MSLTRLGWTPRHEQQFQQHLESGLVPARVAREDRGRYRVHDATGEHAAEVAGRFRHEARGRADFPAVGDWVATRPGEGDGPHTIVALLPPGNIKVRFFVPQTVLPRIAYGEAVTVRCDGCTGDLTAKVSFISKTAEFTPPVIYSLEERAKLVFLIEAVPTEPGNLRVGQPVDVALPGREARP